jgi:hypothetical protein
MDSSMQGNFDRWRASFRKKTRGTELDSECKELARMGCDAIDLECVLFWVADTLDRAQESPANIRQFFRVLDDVILFSKRLTDKLDILSSITMRNEEGAMDAYLAAFGSGRASRICEMPMALQGLQSELKALRIASGGKWPKAPQLRAATEAEVLFVTYIKEATRKNIAFRYGSLLVAACDAYGIEGREYDEEAMLRRHNRFKKDCPEEMAHVAFVAETYVGLRRLPGIRLIPFYIELEIKRLRKVRMDELRRQGHV